MRVICTMRFAHSGAWDPLLVIAAPFAYNTSPRLDLITEGRNPVIEPVRIIDVQLTPVVQN